MATSVQILTGIYIEEGESLSNAVDCSAGRIIRITCPAAWDHATVTFQISTDGNGFNDLFWSDGDEVEIQAAANRGVIIEQDNFGPGFWVKLRSGTLMQPKPQSKKREFAIALLVEAPDLR
jgi:hypothetical protein